MRIAVLAFSLMWLIATLSYTGTLLDSVAIAAGLAVFYAISIAALMMRRNFPER